MSRSRPRFTVVTAVYNVEPYLPDFIRSIEEQRFDLDRVEVIAVDDGSTDGSLALLEAWATRRPGLVKVLSQPNAGQGSARNLGLEQATGEWVTFTDPDDMLDRGFLAVADRFAREHRDVEVLAPNPWLLEEGKGKLTDLHPRRAQFADGNRVADLTREPNAFTGSATIAIFRLDRIRDLGLRYDTRIQPNFEDGHFAVCFLLGLGRPRVGILRDAVYIYRKRAARDSSLQRSLGDARRYTAVFQYGYLDVIERARSRHDRVPEWLQHVLIYELSWYLSADESPSSEIRLPDDLVPRFHELFAQTIDHLEPDVVARHTVRPLKSVWADIFAHVGRPGPWHSSTIALTKVDAQAGLRRIGYRFVGRPPVESFGIDGTAVVPLYQKTMAHSYYGRILVRERIVWLPADGRLDVRLDDTAMKVRKGWPDAPRLTRSLSPADRLRSYIRLSTSGVVATVRRGATRIGGRVAAPVVRAAARSGRYRSTFGDAWALMDRVHNADDNGQRLFEYLRAERPEINAWFVIEKGTLDWDRLRAAGERRVVAYGSFRWLMLMLNCTWLLSSHADIAIVSPPGLSWVDPEPTWKFAFLQHGVIKDDLSRWLNAKDVDLFVVSTEPELHSIVDDDTTYAFTDKETRLTGLPRFDRLLAKARAVAPDDRDLVIVAPTWRTWLAAPVGRTSQRKVIDDTFWDSDYLENWVALLGSQRLADAAARRGWRIGFMPHPNMQPVLSAIDLPPHVEAVTFDDRDVQELYARCALLVTDYSSVAFNVAYVNGPVVYFQFDRDDVLAGGHLGRPGYFDYERDGFGPVATTVDEVVDAIVASIDHGSSPNGEYQARIDRTFVDRDGRACARVVAEVEALSRRDRRLSAASG